MYFQRGNQIFYISEETGGQEELFLTVHTTTSSISLDEQVKVLLRMLERA